LGIRDPDNPAHQLFEAVCSTCGKATKVPFEPRDPTAVQCKDCYLGIETQQQDRSRGAQKISKKVVRVRRP
jgi:CxxC-x17-CxxC domain-containing protein